MKLNLKVEEIMLKEFPIIDKDDTLYHAIKLMEKYDIDRVVAVEDGKLVGIATKKDIMERLGTLRTRTITTSRLYVSSVMTINPTALGPSESVATAIKLMISKDISSIPIINDAKEPIGLITKVEVASLCDKADVKVSEIMSWNPVYVKPTDRVLHARQLLIQNSITTLPVVEGDRVIGLVTIDDVADALVMFHDIVPEKHRKERIMNLLVADIMKVRFPKFHVDTPLSEVARELSSRRLKGAPVLGRENMLAGIVTLTDIVNYLAKIS